MRNIAGPLTAILDDNYFHNFPLSSFSVNAHYYQSKVQVNATAGKHKN